MTTERRFITRHHTGLKVSKRADGAEGRTIEGYAAVFYDGTPETEYQLWPASPYGSGLVERIMPDAFDAALARTDDVRGLFNHDVNEILGRNTAGTMRLTKDARGLRYAIDLPTHQAAQKVAEAIERGDVSGSSFAFDVEPGGQTFRRLSDDLEVREIHGVKLYDVGPVVYPAYTGTTSQVGGAGALGARGAGGVEGRTGEDGLAGVRAAHAAWKRQAQMTSARARSIALQHTGR